MLEMLEYSHYQVRWFSFLFFQTKFLLGNNILFENRKVNWQVSGLHLCIISPVFLTSLIVSRISPIYIYLSFVQPFSVYTLFFSAYVVLFFSRFMYTHTRMSAWGGVWASLSCPKETSLCKAERTEIGPTNFCLADNSCNFWAPAVQNLFE